MVDEVKKPWLTRMMENAADSIIQKHRSDIVEQYFYTHPEARITITPIDIPNFSFYTSTPADLREAGVALCKEADRLEAIPDRKGPVVVIRDMSKMGCEDFLFCDNNEKDVLVWAMNNLSTLRRVGSVEMFNEWWAKDPATQKMRVIQRDPIEGNALPSLLGGDNGSK